MSIVETNQASGRAAPILLGVFAISALASVLCDLLHEFGHAVCTLLPLGVKTISISTIGTTSAGGSNAIVSLAGPLVNFALASTIFLALSPSVSSAWRYFAWLFGTVNLFNATAYLIYSSILGSGDWATVFNAVSPPLLWRPIAGLVGIILYAGSIYGAAAVLRRLCTSGVIAESNIDRFCSSSYWVGGSVITIGSVFNPVSPWFILTSGAATGFGAMLGLLFVPSLLRRTHVTVVNTHESLQIGWLWVVTGAVATGIFIGVFGPGLRLPM